jgi:cobalt-zinc-cadmium efflux system outer membrane protein
MSEISRWPAHCLALVGFTWSWSAAAAPCSNISRANVVRCALVASLDRQAAEAAVRAASGRVQATDPLLPSNPELAFTGARRRTTTDSTLNWSASLGIELEISGQRGARRRAAGAEREAEQRAVSAIERSTAAEALRLYFEVLAAREEQHVLNQLEAASTRVWEAARAAAERGAAAGIEADVADAARVSTQQRRLDATLEERAATASLAGLLGLAATESLVVSGPLEPLKRANDVRRELVPPDSPEVLAFAAEKRAAAARASAFRRSRVPSPRVSVFVERDGFNENVMGVGLAFPLPLPQPIGRTAAGEIAENEALADRAGLLAERERRTARAALARALASYQAALEASRTFSAERVAHAEQSSANLAAEVAAGHLPIRDAIVFQGPLLELQLGAVAARRALCLASLEVMRAAGLPLEGDQP